VELFYNKYVSGIVLKLGGQTTKVMDKGSVEIFGPYGLERKLTEVSKSINSLSTGIVTAYALYILIGLIFFVSTLYYLGADDYELLLITIYACVNMHKIKRSST
jgi:NADH-ubiquinone oxidoreductase chain 5